MSICSEGLNHSFTALLHTFGGFSNIQLFKSANHHAIRSSFYLVATNVQPKIPAATAAVETWKRAWSSATFDFRREEATIEEATICLSVFRETLIRVGKPIWKIHFEALRDANFIKQSKMRLEKDSDRNMAKFSAPQIPFIFYEKHWTSQLIILIH